MPHIASFCVNCRSWDENCACEDVLPVYIGRNDDWDGESRDEQVLETLREKNWVAEDDTISPADIGPGYIWTTETYIAHGQIQNAFSDSDVVVNDIEASDDTPVINLQWVADEPADSSP